jgi:hypothetical protein
MTLENNDGERAINAAANIIERSFQRKFGLPLGSAYWLGMALTATFPLEPIPDKVKLRSSLIGRLEQVVPVELIENGTEGYPGDLGLRVPFSLNTCEYEFCGETVLSLPTGREIIKALPIDPNDRAEFDGYRNRQLGAFLTLHDEYSKAGGDVDPKLKESVEKELS